MFSGGGDSSGDGVNSLNHLKNFPLLSQPTAATSSGIDWATLAQQWIQMRDHSGADIADGPPDAPPPPNISGRQAHQEPTVTKQRKSVKCDLEEQGEADMDMDDEDRSSSPPPPAPSMTLGDSSTSMQGQWFVQQKQANQGVEVDAAKHQQTLWTAWPQRVALPPPGLHVPVMNPVNPTAHIPSLMKINVPHPNAIKAMPDEVNEANVSSSLSTIDAAKRKILPAWIREGLEKMEREKQRHLEREQRHKSRDSSEEAIFKQTDAGKFSGTHEFTVTKNTERSLANDSSGKEDDDDDDDGLAHKYAAAKLGKAPSSKPTTQSEHNDISDFEAERHVGKSYEQRLAELMIAVRRTLTELLLEVTNEEISNIAHEAIKKRKNKGLAAYAESDSDDSNASDNEQSSDAENSEDSEEELRATILRKHRAFAKVCEDIEERIADSTAREEEKLKYYTEMEQAQEEERKLKQQRKAEKREMEKSDYSSKYSTPTRGSKGYERDFGETTTDTKLQHSNGKRQKERLGAHKERVTRFSDNKEPKAAAMAAAANYMSQMQNAASSAAAIPSNATPHLHPAITNDTMQSTYMIPSSSNTGLNNMLSAAEAALEKASNKVKSSSSSHASSNKIHRRRRDRSYSNSSSSSASTSSSHNSKYSRASSSKHKRDGYSERSSSHRKKKSKAASKKGERDRSRERERDRDRDSEREHYSLERSSRHHRRRHRSSDDSNDNDTDDDYYARSSHRSSRHSSSSKRERDRDYKRRSRSRSYTRSRSHSRSHSRSRSSYSTSSKRRAH